MCMAALAHAPRVGTVAAHCSARPCLAVMSMAHCVLLMRTVSPMRAVGSAARKVMLCAERVGKGVRLEGWLRLPGLRRNRRVVAYNTDYIGLPACRHHFSFFDMRTCTCLCIFTCMFAPVHVMPSQFILSPLDVGLFIRRVKWLR